MLGVVLPTPKFLLLEQVRSLWHARAGVNTKFKHRMRHLPQDSGRYLSALRNLQNFTLHNTKVEHISEEGFRTCFSAFRETLTHLSLENSATSFSAFVTLVDYFPNIGSLRLHSFILEPDKGPVSTLSRPLRGRIHVGQVDRLEFYNRFAKLDLEYEELVIDPLEMTFLESALQISASTVKFLKLIAPPPCEHPTLYLPPHRSHVLTPPSHVQAEAGPMVSDFRQLQELELRFGSSGFSYRVLLSSITSTKLRKIILRVFYPLNRYISQQQMEGSALVDAHLCDLVDRLHAVGYHHTLEVELRFQRVEVDPVKDGCVKFLPKFEERGILIITDEVNDGGRLYYSSDPTMLKSDGNSHH